ncbi:predicted protein [Chaetoceros tenuissimus]|uniref:Uncharacterized protein n=1 Tax=Chaetoceros tenuissimus TaxID=426638 RepID=A0AAD3DAR1_9STRA|nr:predicted protein [Chaetoceros tenuissimus]
MYRRIREAVPDGHYSNGQTSSSSKRQRSHSPESHYHPSDRSRTHSLESHNRSRERRVPLRDVNVDDQVSTSSISNSNNSCELSTLRQTNRTLERQSKEKQRIIEDLEEKIKRALEENNGLEDGYLELQEQNDLLTSTIEEKNRVIADLQNLLRSQRARSVQNDQFSIRVSDIDSNMPELRQQSLTRNAGARSVESNQLRTRVSDSDSSASRGRQQSLIRKSESESKFQFECGH